MWSKGFTVHSPGELVKNLNGDFAFIPSPLPPELSITPSLLLQVTEAASALGQLSGLGRRLPNPQRLVRMFLRREAELSSRIEQTFARVQTMVLFEQLKSIEQTTPDVLEVTNNFKTLEAALAQVTERGIITLGQIREMNAILLHNVRGHDQSPGKFRHVQAHIGRTSDIREARFVPAPPHAIQDCMEQLVTYLQAKDGLPPVIRAALVHYQFEAIHPFTDGNGRVGRALLLVQLVNEGVLPAPLLNPSAQMERHREEYYDGLLGVSRDGNWNKWIEFFVRSITEEAMDACRRIEAFENRREAFHAMVRTPRASSLLPPLIDELFADPVVTTAKAKAMFSISSTAAQTLIDRLVELNILREAGNIRRARVYLAQPVVDLFSDAPAETSA